MISRISLAHLPNETAGYVVASAQPDRARWRLPGVVIASVLAVSARAARRRRIFVALALRRSTSVWRNSRGATSAGWNFLRHSGTIGGALRMNAGANGSETKMFWSSPPRRPRPARSMSSTMRHEVHLSQQRRRSFDHLTAARFRGLMATPEVIRGG